MSKKSFKTSIGGQALIEGVMMRGPDSTAMAVRLPGGEIDVEQWENGPSSKRWYRKAPFIRGIFGMLESLTVGYKCLMKSAEKSTPEGEEDSSKFDQWISEKLGGHLSTVVGVVSTIIGVGLAIALFMILPAFLVGLLGKWVELSIVKSLLEGLLKIAIFVAYLALVSQMKDIRRVFMYHGAEHKTIACYEAGEALTVENIRGKSRFHPRCGTSFLFIVLIISILVFSVVTWSHVLIRVLLKLALLPVVVGVSYEIIKFAGRHNNPLTRVISAPGLWLQRLTTKEPEDDQIQVAIASMTPVIPREAGTDAW